MTHVIADRVHETSTTTGTGTYTLGGAKSSAHRAFAAVCADSDTVAYSAWDATNGGWEVGIGTWGTGNTLARTQILASSNSGAAVSWSAGTREVVLTHPADHIKQAPAFVLHNELGVI